MLRIKSFRHTVLHLKLQRRGRRCPIPPEQLERRALLSINFGPPTNYNYSGLNYPNEITASDLNGDGKLDLLTPIVNLGSPSGHGYVSVQLGNGDGTFQNAQGYVTGYQPLSLAVADFNLDGKPDVATADEATDAQGNSKVSVLLGQGDGTLAFDGDHPAAALGAPSRLRRGISTGTANPTLSMALCPQARLA